MKSKSILIVLIFALLIPITLFMLWHLSIISGAIFNTIPNPPAPEITNGEFPITITYEINGHKKRIDDIIICEFDGFENMGSAGKYRKWKSYLKSGNNNITLLQINEHSKLYCNYGLPEYYMDDLRFQTKEEYEQNREHDFESHFIIHEKLENGELFKVAISANEAMEKYGLKIINVQYSQPIKNTFN